MTTRKAWLTAPAALYLIGVFITLATACSAPKEPNKEPNYVLIRAPSDISEPQRLGLTPVDQTPLGFVDGQTKAPSEMTLYEAYFQIKTGDEIISAERASWCRYNVPIFEMDYDAPPIDDGCNGCEGPPFRLLGYIKMHCGPFQYYSESDCERDRFAIFRAVLDNLQAGGGGDPDMDGLRLICRSARSQYYPISWSETRDAKKALKASKVNP